MLCKYHIGAIQGHFIVLLKVKYKITTLWMDKYKMYKICLNRKSAELDPIQFDWGEGWLSVAAELNLEDKRFEGGESKNTKKRTWKPRERVSPACFPPNQDLLVAVKVFPEAGVTSASQKVILLKGKSVSISNSNVAIAEATGRLKVAPNAPLQPLFPERSDSQFPLTPGGGKVMPWHDLHLQWLLLLAHWW